MAAFDPGTTSAMLRLYDRLGERGYLREAELFVAALEAQAEGEVDEAFLLLVRVVQELAG